MGRRICIDIKEVDLAAIAADPDMSSQFLMATIDKFKDSSGLATSDPDKGFSATMNMQSGAERKVELHVASYNRDEASVFIKVSDGQEFRF